MLYLDKKYIGEVLKMHRKTLKYTQEQVAENVGVEPEHYGKLERGIFYPSVVTFLKLLNFLKISIKDFGINDNEEINSTQGEIIKEVLISNDTENKLFLSIIKNIKDIKIK